MSQTYYSGYEGNNPEYIQQLVSKEVNKYRDQGKVQNALYNPVTGDIHVTSDNTEKELEWSNYPKVSNVKKYNELKALSASGKLNNDQATYGHYYPEFQDQALRFHEAYKAKGAAVITSTEFPQLTVQTVSQALLNRQQLVTQKYNLLGVPEKISTQLLDVIFPEYNDTTTAVRVGYKENEAIDTTGYGSFTQTSISMKKAGAGLAFTEEYYMKQFTFDIQGLILQKITNDFVKARYTRILSKIQAFSGATGADWAAYTAGNLQSTNRPYNDLNSVRTAINSDKLAIVDTIVTNEKQWIDFYTNTWVRGLFNQDAAATQNLNQIINAPPGIPWCRQWIINEDVPNDTAYIFDSRAVVDIEGPRKTQQINTYNPDQTVFIQKEWFDVVAPSTRTGWGRVLTSI